MNYPYELHGERRSTFSAKRVINRCGRFGEVIELDRAYEVERTGIRNYRMTGRYRRVYNYKHTQA